jgi:hypothetical protein
MTKLYDRTRDGVSLDEVERVVFELLRMGVVEAPLCSLVNSSAFKDQLNFWLDAATSWIISLGGSRGRSGQ